AALIICVRPSIATDGSSVTLSPYINRLQHQAKDFAMRVIGRRLAEPHGCLTLTAYPGRRLLCGLGEPPSLDDGNSTAQPLCPLGRPASTGTIETRSPRAGMSSGAPKPASRFRTWSRARGVAVEGTPAPNAPAMRTVVSAGACQQCLLMANSGRAVPTV